MIFGGRKKQNNNGGGQNLDDIVRNMTRRNSADATEQFKLDLKKSRWDFFYGVKNRFSRMTVLVEALPYWKNLNTIVALVSSFSFVAVMFYVISKDYLLLPSNLQIPIIYLQASQSWQPEDKEILLLIPVITGALLVLLLNFSSSIYKFDRRLSFMINFGIIMFNILGAIAFFQLLSLILIY
jgi:hypothetical protein